jgi:hypothetical protein
MTKYYLAREIEKARAKHKPIEIVLPKLEPEEGQHEGYQERTVEVPPAQLWSDDISVAAQYNPVQAARQLLGDANYEHWRYAGGTAGILFEIIREVGGAASVGESSGS